MRKDIMIMIVVSLLVLCNFSLVACEEKKEPTADIADNAVEKVEKNGQQNKQAQSDQSKAVKKGESKYLKDFGIAEEFEKEFRKEQKL